MTEKLLILLTGWLLGLAGQWIIELTQRSSRKRLIKRSLFIELRELRQKLIAIAFQLAANNGTLDRILIAKAKEIRSVDKAFYENTDMENALELVLKLNDDELQKELRKLRGKEQSFMLKKYAAPFLTSQLGSLSLFSPEFQRLGLEIHSSLSILNEEIDFYRSQFEKTFSKPSRENLAILNINIETTSGNIVNVCNQISDKIKMILQQK